MAAQICSSITKFSDEPSGRSGTPGQQDTCTPPSMAQMNTAAIWPTLIRLSCVRWYFSAIRSNDRPAGEVEGSGVSLWTPPQRPSHIQIQAMCSVLWYRGEVSRCRTDALPRRFIHCLPITPHFPWWLQQNTAQLRREIQAYGMTIKLNSQKQFQQHYGLCEVEVIAGLLCKTVSDSAW